MSFPLKPNEQMLTDFSRLCYEIENFSKSSFLQS